MRTSGTAWILTTVRRRPTATAYTPKRGRRAAACPEADGAMGRGASPRAALRGRHLRRAHAPRQRHRRDDGRLRGPRAWDGQVWDLSLLHVLPGRARAAARSL